MSDFKYIVNLDQNHGFQWFSQSFGQTVISVKGYVFYSEVLYRDQAFARLVFEHLQGASVQALNELLKKFLLALNGSFSVIVQARDWLWAAVDRVRSMPLFYGFKNDSNLLLSDDALWLREQIGDAEPDPLRVKEFMLTGYVTGPHTLFPDVKQLQAGEFLLHKRIEGKQDFATCRYYRWLHGDYSDATEEELCAEMDLMHQRVFQRLLTSTEGRTIVVPLSGGYDSRLIVTMLKRLGKEDVICFSYGLPGNWESKISKSVAERLGYPWFFVPYDHSRWRRWFASQERQSYSLKSSGLCSIAVIQDFPAVWELARSKKIPETAIFVPGHTGDFISGGHIPSKWGHIAGSNQELLFEGVVNKHYSLWPLQYKQVQVEFQSSIFDQISDFTIDCAEEMASVFEYWEWQERQAKFIVNSVRVYEWWGYEWRLPLWDNDVMEYWRRVPFQLRLHKLLYDRYAQRLFLEFDVAFSHSNLPLHTNILKARMMNFLDRFRDPRWGRYSTISYLKTIRLYSNTFSLINPFKYLSALTLNTLGASDTIQLIVALLRQGSVRDT